MTTDYLWYLNPEFTSRGQVPKLDMNLDQGKSKPMNEISILPAILKTFGSMFFHGALMKIACGKSSYCMCLGLFFRKT